MYLLHLPKVDDINMEIHLDMYFRQFWKDPRLAFSNVKKVNTASVKNIKNSRLKTRVWLPDPFFVNQKEGKVLDNPSDNTIFKIEADGKLKLLSNIQIPIYLIFVIGDVMFSTRQLVTTSCYMDLHKYPFE